MELREALLTRRTIHNYLPGSIPEGAIERALEAAIRAPNHKLTNPWRFTRVGPEVREKFIELGIEMKRKKKKEITDKYEAYLREKYGNPAELVVVSVVIDADPFRRREDYAATACAIQNFCLSLWGEAVGSKWSTGGMSRHENAYAMLGIDPDEEEIIAFVWAGRPDEIPEPPRHPLEKVVRTTP